MTEDEWRRSHIDPGDLRRAASEVRHRADDLLAPYQRLLNEIGGVRWAGVAASHFSAEMRDHGQSMLTVRRLMNDAADAMDREARRLENDLEQVRKEERGRKEREERERQAKLKA